jgi:radical SAM superfamily enzyme YgiQ (UPF0313 family)
MKRMDEKQTDIVLLQLPFSGISCPPLGLALLKSYLSENNISCKVFDINAHVWCSRADKHDIYWDMIYGYDYCEDRDKMLEYYKYNRASFLYYMSQINRLNPKIVGCSCKNSSFILTQIFLEDLRNHFPRFKHILGGPEVAFFMNNADDLLSRDYIDAVNLDEGEVSLVNYFHTVKKNLAEPIAGLVYKKDGHIIKGGFTQAIKDLNKLPFADFSDFNLKQYFSPDLVVTLPIYTSRGCVNKCIYCSSWTFMKPYRIRSAESIFEEIKHQKQRHPEVTCFRTADNICNSNIKELEKFCDLMIEAKLGVKWNLEDAIIRKEMQIPLYKKLKKAGCFMIGYGLESPSKKLLAGIGKFTSRDVDITAVIRDARKAGIDANLNIMFGLPGETEEDFTNLLEFIRKNRRAIIMLAPSITFCEFYPGSLGCDNPEKYGLDLSKGSLFWETIDGTNTYLTRMKRFETFCKVAKKYKLNTLFNIEELPNRHKLLFRYYFISKEYENALKEYDNIVVNDRTNQLKRMHSAIKTNDFTVLKEPPIPLRDILPYGETFGETFLMSSISETLEGLSKVDIFRNMWLKPWQKKVRHLAHRAIGYDRISKKIDNSYSMLKILDEKLTSYFR